MDFAEYFGDNLRAAPEPEQFETFEQWTWRWIHEERITIESLVRESVSTRVEPPQPQAPPIPDGMPVNASIVEAWRRFYSAPRTLSKSRPYTPKGERPRRRPGVRELHTFVADQQFDHLLQG